MKDVLSSEVQVRFIKRIFQGFYDQAFRVPEPEVDGLHILGVSPSGDLIRDKDHLRRVLGQYQDYPQMSMNSCHEEYYMGRHLASANPKPEWLIVFKSLLEDPPEWWIILNDDNFFDEAFGALLAEWLHQRPEAVAPFVLSLFEDRKHRLHVLHILHSHIASGGYALPAELSGCLPALAQEVGDMSESEAELLVSAVGELGTEASKGLLLQIQNDLPGTYQTVANDIKFYL